jgi:hypothetical protein
MASHAGRVTHSHGREVPDYKREETMSRLTNSDLLAVPGYTLREEDKFAPVSLDQLQATARNCYLVIAVNTVWLLIPLIGMLTGNNVVAIFFGLVVAAAVLFVANNYLARKWYYNSDAAKGTVYESHYERIDYIGFVTFFVTMVSTLAFMIISVFAANIFKGIGQQVVLVLDIAFSGLLIVLAVWILKQCSKGLATGLRKEPFA